MSSVYGACVRLKLCGLVPLTAGRRCAAAAATCLPVCLPGCLAAVFRPAHQCALSLRVPCCFCSCSMNGWGHVGALAVADLSRCLRPAQEAPAVAAVAAAVAVAVAVAAAAVAVAVAAAVVGYPWGHRHSHLLRGPIPMPVLVLALALALVLAALALVLVGRSCAALAVLAVFAMQPRLGSTS